MRPADAPTGGTPPPLGRVMQICFVVPDLDRALAPFAATFGAGPWFVTTASADGPGRPLPASYRGRAAPIGADIALAYGGEMMYELACPLSRVDSIWSERVQTHGYGLHHLGFGVTDFDGAVTSLRRAGREHVMSATTPRGARVVMVGGDGPLGVFEEYIELTEHSLAFYALMKAQADAWDGAQLRYGGSHTATGALPAERLHQKPTPRPSIEQTGPSHG